MLEHNTNDTTICWSTIQTIQLYVGAKYIGHSKINHMLEHNTENPYHTIIIYHIFIYKYITAMNTLNYIRLSQAFFWRHFRVRWENATFPVRCVSIVRTVCPLLGPCSWLAALSSNWRAVAAAAAKNPPLVICPGGTQQVTIVPISTGLLDAAKGDGFLGYAANKQT